MSVKVKICSIRSLDAAEAAVNAGADYLGFNFVTTSKRYIDPEKAGEIIKQIRQQSKIKIVGVFQDTSYDKVSGLVGSLSLDLVQLHGHEDNDYILRMQVPVMKSFTLADRPEDIEAPYLLLDRAERGVGEMIDQKMAAELAQRFTLFLAGGLTPANVIGAVPFVKPFAVDVAGGVETDGQQDLEKIKSFVENAKSA